MHKILATAFIMALTTCYPVHAATKYIVGAEMKFEKKVKITTKDFSNRGIILYDTILYILLKHSKCRSKCIKIF